PVRFLEPGGESLVPQRPHRLDQVMGLDKQVQVLRFPVDSSVLVDGVRPRDHEGNACAIQGAERALVLLPLLLGYPEVAVSKGPSFFAGQPLGSRKWRRRPGSESRRDRSGIGVQKSNRQARGVGTWLHEPRCRGAEVRAGEWQGGPGTAILIRTCLRTAET